eukprot:gene7882-biopygen5301
MVCPPAFQSPFGQSSEKHTFPPSRWSIWSQAEGQETATQRTSGLRFSIGPLYGLAPPPHPSVEPIEKMALEGLRWRRGGSRWVSVVAVSSAAERFTTMLQ